MRQIGKRILALGMILLLLTGCQPLFPETPGEDDKSAPAGSSTVSDGSDPAGETASHTDDPEREPPIEQAAKIVQEMSIEEKIGQVILMEFRQWAPGASGADEKNTDMEKDSGSGKSPAALTVLNDEIRDVIASYHLGNIILFAENCADPAQLTKLCYDLQHASIDAGGDPLLIGVDQEGGNITRLSGACCMSGSMAIGASGDVENARKNGQVIGSELAAVGINCDFAPDADVNRNRNNPVIGMRSFSADPEVVAEMALAMEEAMAAQHVIPCAKHFPGHGNTDTDSHTGLPLVEADDAQWLATDGLPFAKLAEAHIPMMMTAHIQFPGLDPTKVRSRGTGEEIYLPATLSKTILTDILRGQLGYEGVVVTDAINMDAIKDHFGKSEAILMALNAGADLLCMPVTLRSTLDIPALDELYATIKNAVADGTLPEKRLNEAAVRVVALKIAEGIWDADYDFDVNAAMAHASEFVGGKENRAIEREVASNCVTLQYGGTYAPFAPSGNQRVVVCMPYQNEVTSVKYAVRRMLSEKAFDALNVEYYCYEGMSALPDAMKKAVASADYLIVGTEQTASTMKNASHWLNVMPRAILSAAKTKQVALLCAGLPYQAEEFREKYPCFVLYNYTGMDAADLTAEKFKGKYGPAFPAGIDRIFGR